MSDENTAKGRLEKLRNEIESVSVWWPVSAGPSLQSHVDEALGFSEPDGDPAHIAGTAKKYANAAAQVDRVFADVRRVGAAGLPEVWIGEASSAASKVTEAAAYTAEQMAETFEKAGKELRLLSEDLASAKSRHGSAQSPLHHAKSLLGAAPAFCGEDDLVRARDAALDGLDTLVEAFDLAEKAGRRATRELDDLTSEARAHRLDADSLTAADRILLASAAAPSGGDNPEDNEILSASDLERAGTRMDELSATDREAFDDLLDGAKSPQERAYLMKALAAGYDLDEIQDFGTKIHPYGDDPQWLQQHLTPVVTEGDSKTDDDDVMFGDKQWTQGAHPTCVVSSTITARATVDPLYALELTTGGHPGDPAYDNPDAFAERLREEQAEMHEEGGGKPDTGMSIEEGGEAADREISPHTGAEYEQVDLESSQDRREVLPDIRDAVNEGRPVPVGVKGPDSAHQMMIIGQEGDMLQIYNPWGHTTWVSEEAFVNGEIGSASSSDLPEPYYLQMPQ